MNIYGLDPSEEIPPCSGRDRLELVWLLGRWLGSAAVRRSHEDPA